MAAEACHRCCCPFAQCLELLAGSGDSTGPAYPGCSFPQSAFNYSGCQRCICQDRLLSLLSLSPRLPAAHTVLLTTAETGTALHDSGSTPPTHFRRGPGCLGAPAGACGEGGAAEGCTLRGPREGCNGRSTGGCARGRRGIQSAWV